MQTGLALGLIPLGLVLVIGLASIAAASAREGQLEAGVQPDAARRSKARIVGIVTLVGFCGVLYLGNSWWTAQAEGFGRMVYKPLGLKATVKDGNRLVLQL